MKKLNAHRIGIDNGTVHLFSDFVEDGEMWSGEGDRVRRVRVNFTEPFLTPPMVQVGFTLWDISNTANTRVDLRSDAVTETHFDIVFTTWGDTKIARMHANWFAIGDVNDDEVWDV